MGDLGTELGERFPGARVQDAGASVLAEIAVDGVVYRARLAMEPEASVVVALPSTDGFELRLRWTDRFTDGGAPRAAAFDDSFLIETNDLALATTWLDGVARSALLASRYVSGHQPERHTAVMYRDAAWVYEVSNDEVSARRRDPEPSVDRMGDILLASLVLASRPVRWASSFEVLGRELGGESAPRIEIGGRPVLRVRRGNAEVLVHVVRRRGPGDPGRLRTIVGAHRRSGDGETLPLAAELLVIANPSATTVRPHEVEIAFDGALFDRERLGAAIELAARWANHAYDTGPYR